MAKEYEVEINGQPAWYSNQVRPFKIYFAEPENQVNSGTGILLFIAGYGGNANSHVYQKMRRKFADMYNFVTLQCDYLGWQFMQDDQHLAVTEQMLRQELTPREFRNLEKDYAGNQKILQGKVFSGEIDLGEDADQFNEMGMCQAMDHLMAMQVLLDRSVSIYTDSLTEHIWHIYATGWHRICLQELLIIVRICCLIISIMIDRSRR